MIVEGKSDEEIANRHFSTWIIHRRAFAEYRTLMKPDRDWKSDVFIYWGDTGTGKTRAVYEAEADLWIATDNSLNWFDGYTGQEAVLFDDFVSIKNEKFGFLLRLLDRYPMDVPVKGGFTKWLPKRIYFTSNLRVEDWFMGVSAASQSALRRRITDTVHFCAV